jgi:hypothetical protein
MVAQTHLPLILERPIHRFLCCCFTLALLLCVNASRADEPAAPATTAATLAPSRRIEVRLSMSRAAAEALGEARIRRLLELELDDVGTLAQAPGGPLGDFVAHVWLDVLSPPQVLIEARFAERPVTRRFIAIEGLTSDVSARLVAIAANELVRAQARPIRPRKETKPRPPTAQEIELAKRLAPAIVWSVGPSVAFQPMSSGFIWGPNVSLGFRAMGATERIFARWLTGTTTAGSTSASACAFASRCRPPQGPAGPVCRDRADPHAAIRHDACVAAGMRPVPRSLRFAACPLSMPPSGTPSA